MRAYTSFNYWMKRVVQQRPLRPLTSTTLCPSTNIPDKWVEPKLRLAFECTKITISASPRAILLNHWKTVWITQVPLIPWGSIWWSSCLSSCCLCCGRSSWRCRCRCSQYRWNRLCRWNNVFTWSRRLYLFKWQVEGGNRNTRDLFHVGRLCEDAMVIQQRLWLLDVLSRLRLSISDGSWVTRWLKQNLKLLRLRL